MLFFSTFVFSTLIIKWSLKALRYHRHPRRSYVTCNPHQGQEAFCAREPNCKLGQLCPSTKRGTKYLRSPRRCQCAASFTHLTHRLMNDFSHSAPAWFFDTQRAGLEKAASDAGVKILLLLDEAGAAAATTTTDVWITDLQADRT